MIDGIAVNNDPSGDIEMSVVKTASIQYRDTLFTPVGTEEMDSGAIVVKCTILLPLSPLNPWDPL